MNPQDPPLDLADVQELLARVRALEEENARMRAEGNQLHQEHQFLQRQVREATPPGEFVAPPHVNQAPPAPPLAIMIML